MSLMARHAASLHTSTTSAAHRAPGKAAAGAVSWGGEHCVFSVLPRPQRAGTAAAMAGAAGLGGPAGPAAGEEGAQERGVQEEEEEEEGGEGPALEVELWGSRDPK